MVPPPRCETITGLRTAVLHETETNSVVVVNNTVGEKCLLLARNRSKEISYKDFIDCIDTNMLYMW